MVWATAFGGAALMLTGVGAVSDALELLNKPGDPTESTILVVLWVAPALLGRSVQLRLLRDDPD